MNTISPTILGFHATTVLMTWLALLFGLNQLPSAANLFCHALGLIGLSIHAPRQMLLMFKRMRYLIASLFLLMGWNTVGDAVFNAYYAPTWQGLQFGLSQVLHLAFIAASIRFLWQRYSEAQMLEAFHHLFLPLGLLNFSVSKLTLRLALTLQVSHELLGQDQPLTAKSLLNQLLSKTVMPNSLPICNVYPFKTKDWLVLGLIILMLITFVFLVI
ncbi:MAG: hypothetical protein K2P98_06610 [Neisseriaceae bacterium]|nr:hypothetical protein [Neisseriaceae bacterium]